MVAEAVQNRHAGEIRYTWGGPQKQPQNPEPVKAADPEPVNAAEAPWVVTQPDDKTPDPADESNQVPPEDTAPITRHLPPLFQ